MIELASVIILAFLLDLLFGDPRWLYHPVQAIGKTALFFEKISRVLFSNKRVGGFLTVIFTIGITMIVLSGLLYLCAQYSKYLFYTVAVIVLYTSVATRDLIRHSVNIYKAMAPVLDLKEARSRLSWIVGRDTRELDEKAVVRATVESVAENLVDGITAPLIWALFFSCFSSNSETCVALAATGAYFYKSVNTMDSMFGYKNEKFLDFGFFAAKLDDLVNFIPARLTGVMIISASFLGRLNWRECARVFVIDRKNHTSPNAGHPEAAFAGALGIQLGGSSCYGGKMVEKPSLGVSVKEVEPKDIKRANRLALITAVLTLVCIVTIRIATGLL